MPAGVQIQEFRLSFIWTESILGALTRSPAPAIPRPEVRDRSAYAAYFDGAAGAAARPWPGRFQGFWEEYLEHKPLPDVSGQIAYRQLVPLRVANVVRPRTLDPDAVTANVEGLLYPWGTGLIVTVRYRHGWPDLETPVEAAAQIRGEPWYRGPADGRVRRLDDVAHDALTALRTEAFGDLPGTVLTSEPFSIHTVVRASGARDDMSPGLEPVQRFLHGVTSFSASWASDELPEIKEVTVGGRRNRPPDHILYGRRRGRAVWAPDSALKPGGAVHTLGCQHRNLVLASAHHENVAGFMKATADHIHASGGLLSTHRMLAKRAGVALARGYHGTSTYRSGSLRHQIEANGWLPDIDFVRREVELPPVVAAS